MRIDNPNLTQFSRTYPWFRWVSIQTFDDNIERKDPKLAKIYPLRKWILEDLKKKNADWAWIFFSVNQMLKGKRDVESVTAINSRIVEIDEGKNKEDQMYEYMSEPIKPSCIIESKNSLHAYYFSKDWTVENRKKICRWLQKRFWGDPKVIDISRVLRLPWFYHAKDENDRFFVNCRFIDDELVYTEKEMLEAFPYTEERKTTTIKRVQNELPSNIREFLATLDNKYILERLSYSSLIWWDAIEFRQNANWTEQIFVNGKSSSCWIDENGFIGSSDRWWPTWIQWVMRYGSVTKWQLLKWAIDNLKDDIPFHFYKAAKEDVELKSQMVKDSINENFRHITYEEKMAESMAELMSTDPDKVIKRWRKEFDDHFWGIYTWRIYLFWSDTGLGKSTMINAICRNIDLQWHTVVKYSLEDRMVDVGKQEIFYSVNRIRFNRWLPKYLRPQFVNNEYGTKKSPYYDDLFDDLVFEAATQLSQSNIIELEKNKQINIDELCELMEDQAEKWCRFFAIDHLHYFEKRADTWRSDIEIENAMHRLNELARRQNVAIFLVAHYRKFWSQENQYVPSLDLFKDASAIKQVASVVIQMTRERDSNETTFHITKMRWPIQVREIIWYFDLSTFEYTFEKTEEQKRKEADTLKKREKM